MTKVWAIVEVMGHKRFAGEVSRDDTFGAPLLRIDVPQTAAADAFTKLFGGSSIFGITPVSEAIARAEAERIAATPVERWVMVEINALLPSGASSPLVLQDDEREYGWEGDEDRADGPSWDEDVDGPLDAEDGNAWQGSTGGPYFDHAPAPRNAADKDWQESAQGFPLPSFQQLRRAEPAIDDEDTQEYRLMPTKSAARQEACRLARALESLATPYVVLDCETTGMGYDDQVIQIAIVHRDGTLLLDTRVKPTVPITDGARAVHGITDEMLEDAPSFSQIVPDLKRVLEGRRVVIYNADFDLRILTQTLAALTDLSGGFTDVRSYFGISSVHCAMEAFAMYYGEHGRQGWKWQKLTTACTYFGIVAEAPAHSALGDAQRTRALIKKMAAAE